MMVKVVGSALKFSCMLFLGGLLSAPLSIAQSSSASATPASPSAASASTLTIRGNILVMKQADIQRQIKDAELCIKNASNPTILRDPQGNINRVPSTDLVNCTRTLVRLRRQLRAVANQANQLSVEANFRAARAQRLLQRGRTTLTIRQLRSSGSDSASTP
jgi:hypothetical protein